MKKMMASVICSIVTVTLAIGGMIGCMAEDSEHKYKGQKVYSVENGVLYVSDVCDKCGDVSEEKTVVENSVVATAETAVAELTDATDGEVVFLSQNVVLDAPLTIDASISIVSDGKTVSGAPLTIKGANVVLEGVAFADPVNANDNASSIYVSEGAESIIIKGCAFSNAAWDSMQITATTLSDIQIIGNTFKNTEKGYRYVHVEIREDSAATLTMKENVFENISADYVQDSAITVYGIKLANMSISDNIVKGAGAEDFANGSIIWISDGVNTETMMGADAIKDAFEKA